MLKIEHVTKQIESFRLKDISFHLPPGYIMGLIGPNGAGKTSLIHLILGLYQLEEGNIYIDGLSIKEEEKAVKERVAFVLVENYFLKEISLVENAQMFGKYYSQFEMRLFLTYCEEFSLEPQRKLGKLSRGEGMKFQFAFALSHQPKLLILDEPTANFDPEFREKIIRKMSDFVADGEHSILLSTHMTEELDQLADYITLLQHGELVFSIDKETMYDTYKLIGGEEYKMNLIPREQVIYQEKGEYGTKALVKYRRYYTYDKELVIENPSVEDVMYFMKKGEKAHVKNGTW